MEPTLERCGRPRTQYAMGETTDAGFMFDVTGSGEEETIRLRDIDDEDLEQVTSVKEVHRYVGAGEDSGTWDGSVQIKRDGNDVTELSLAARKKREWRANPENMEIEKKARAHRKQLLLSRETDDMKAARLAKQREAKRRQRMRKKLLAVKPGAGGGGSHSLNGAGLYERRKCLVEVVKTVYYTHSRKVDGDEQRGTDVLVEIREEDGKRKATVVQPQTDTTQA